MSRARYIMVGGFLGAGKTTALGAFARHLDAAGLRVGLITNDQGAGLVDSALGRAGRFPVEEIAGGCFCCRFDSLLDAARHLTAATRPDVFLAEPVGSCTDLVATVSLPLNQIYGDDYVVAPLSVLVDPLRALRVLGLEEGARPFSPNVAYIYRKQLEEAEVIVVNKLDLLDEGRRGLLRAGLERAFPRAQVREVSARGGTGLEDWFGHLMAAEMDVSRTLDIDYARYGEGEALLGWLNCTVEIEAPGPAGDGTGGGGEVDEFDGNALLVDLAEALRGRLAEDGGEVAHLKMTLNPIGDPYEVGAVNLVRSGSHPELSHRLPDPLEDGELLLNMRVESPPEKLREAAEEALEAVLARGAGLTYRVTHAEHFRPGKPVPTHRLTAPSAKSESSSTHPTHIRPR